jgi:glycosyltransferase involved in cell wall biosynthesis
VIARRSPFEVVVATYGSNHWRDCGDRAAQDIEITQSYRLSSVSHVVKVTRVHLPDGTLAQARNLGAAMAKGSWLVFLDADDALSPGYVEAMYRAAFMLAGAEKAAQGRVEALLVPQVRYVRSGRPQAPQFPREVPVEDGNWLVIGTAVPRHLFCEVGGFAEYPVYEDWALFARCQIEGATPVRVPDAVYLARRRTGSRNDASRQKRVYWHQRIGHDLWPHLYDDTTEEENRREMLLHQDGRRARLRVRRLA